MGVAVAYADPPVGGGHEVHQGVGGLRGLGDRHPVGPGHQGAGGGRDLPEAGHAPVREDVQPGGGEFVRAGDGANRW